MRTFESYQRWATRASSPRSSLRRRCGTLSLRSPACASICPSGPAPVSLSDTREQSSSLTLESLGEIPRAGVRALENGAKAPSPDNGEQRRRSGKEVGSHHQFPFSSALTPFSRYPDHPRAAHALSSMPCNPSRRSISECAVTTLCLPCPPPLMCGCVVRVPAT